MEVTVRPGEKADLRELEWFGLFTPHREIIEEAFRRHEAGDNVMLVADAGGHPIGQVWIDLAKRDPERVGYIWALRVFPWFRGLGLGRMLLEGAEGLLRARGFHVAEIGVERTNTRARALYERMGYRVVAELHEDYSYTTPDGVAVDATVDEILLQKRL